MLIDMTDVAVERVQIESVYEFRKLQFSPLDRSLKAPIDILDNLCQ